MKQLVAQVVVAFLFLAVVGLFVWMWRARRASLASGAVALAELSRELGTTYEPSMMPRLSGTYTGRACSIQQSRRPHGEDDATFVRVEIACRSTTGFQVVRRKAGMAGDGVDGVLTGDDTFDTQLVVRCADRARALAVLDPARRSRFVEWFRQGWIDDLRCRDGRLMIEGGYGLREGIEVERARLLLDEGVAIAEALERVGAATPR
jgi:hypothetical protein